MPGLVRVLMVEDVADDAALVERELRRAGITGATRRVDSEGGFREALQPFGPDVILTDHSLPTFGAADALRIGLPEAPDTPVIVVTGSLDEETAAEYIKAGAADYVVTPPLERVGPAVVRALDLRRARTEQARGEGARRQGEERFRALIERGAAAAALVAPDGPLLSASHSIERLLGFAPAELVGHPGFERVHPDDVPRVHAALREIIASPGTPAGLELRWRHKDGSWRHIDAVAVDRLAEPAVGAIVVNVRDVSERRRAEAALRESEERYRTLVEGVRDIIFALSPEGTIASLNPAFETIAGWRREEWVGQPFERLVHPEDLPLALELLGRVVRGELRPASQFRVRTAKGDYRVGEFSASPQLHEGRLVGILGIGRDVTERVQLEQQLRQAQKMEAVGRLAGGIAHDFNNILTAITGYVDLLLEDLPPGDPRRNDAQEVRKAADRAAGLTRQLLAFSRQQVLQPRVVGMTPEVQAHLFEPFFTTKERGKGTGLGLATVYGIVKQSGGFIWVYTEPGRGSSFKVYLPRVDESVQPREATAGAGAKRGTETVLLAEDEAPVRAVARHVLERHGYHVLEAPSAEAALDLARRYSGDIHVLLTDVVMPGLSGPDLARQLVALRPAVRVIYMSGYTDDAITRHGVLEPGLAYVQKPFTPEAIARKVREVLDAA